MMYGVVKNSQGQIVGQHKVDPTAPGGIQGQMNQIAAAQGAGPGPAQALHRGAGPAVPQPGVMPAQVFLQFQIRLPNGQTQQVTRAIQLSPAMGIPPGVYVLHAQR
jgi:hypothetical protein